MTHLPVGLCKRLRGGLGAVVEHLVPVFLIFLVANFALLCFTADITSYEETPWYFYAADSFFVCDILLKWCHSFKDFWRNPWYVLDFALVLPLLILPLSSDDVQFRVAATILRTFRCFRIIPLTPEANRIFQGIVRGSIDFISVALLLSFSKTLYAIIGVLAFRRYHPGGFRHLSAALYVTFICFTEEGWLLIYKTMDKNNTLQYVLVTLFFIVAIVTLGILINSALLGLLLGNLDESSSPGEEEHLSDETDVAQELESSPGVWQQTSTSLDSLPDITPEELEEAREAMLKDREEYQRDSSELERLVDAHILENSEQDEEVLQRGQQATLLLQFLQENPEATGRTEDFMSAFVALEKVNIIDLASNNPWCFHWHEVCGRAQHRGSGADVEAHETS